MNIWIFNHYAITPNFSGGTRHFDLAKQLVNKGHKVTIVASSFNHFARIETKSYNGKLKYQIEKIEGVNFLWIKTPPYKNSLQRILNILFYSNRAYKVGKKLLASDKPDLIIGSTVHPLAALVATKLAKINNILFYFEERDLWPQTFVDFSILSPKNPIVKLLYRLEEKLYKDSSKIIVLFDKAVNYVQSRSIDFKKVLYIPNGINEESIKNLKRAEKVDSLLKGLENKFKIIYAGSHGEANYLNPIIDLASHLQEQNDNIHIIMIGDGVKKQELIEKAKSNNLVNVSFFNPISKGEMPYLLSRMDLSFISLKKSPLYKWGFSMNKIYDYMLSGLPLIMYYDQSLVGKIMDSKGIIASEDINHLSCKIQELYYNKDMLDVMSRNLKEYVITNHSWSNLSNMLIEEVEKDLLKKKTELSRQN